MNEKYKRLLKFAAIALVIVAVTVGVAVLSEYIRYRRSPEYQIQQAMRDLERRYAEDTYGGSTPEETLQLFIDALKREDVELASKYFVLDEQDKWLKNLKTIREGEMLGAMIHDFEREKFKHAISEGQISFTIANDQNEVALTILMGKGPNGRWKIIDL